MVLAVDTHSPFAILAVSPLAGGIGIYPCDSQKSVNNNAITFANTHTALFMV